MPIKQRPENKTGRFSRPGLGKLSGPSLHEVLFYFGNWTFRDSNPGPAGYEPAALTN